MTELRATSINGFAAIELHDALVKAETALSDIAAAALRRGELLSRFLRVLGPKAGDMGVKSAAEFLQSRPYRPRMEGLT